MAKIDYENARRVLDSLYTYAENNSSAFANQLNERLCAELDVVFSSQTQSYREVLLGCALIHAINVNIDIRRPYIKQGENAFNGRTLDEEVINPFLQEKLIPCSKSPFWATFRRNVMLTDQTKAGLRDKKGYEAMLHIISQMENQVDSESRESMVVCLLVRFINLRDLSRVPLINVSRLSIDQFDTFIELLLARQSGGLLPVLLTVAFYKMLNKYYEKNWDISWQGINVADKATGVDGDISIAENGQQRIAIEVTERPIDKRRVTSTFNTKISHSEASAYLFAYTNTRPDESALQAAQNLFTQGYEVNFVAIKNLIINGFLSQEPTARVLFMEEMLLLLDKQDVLSSIKLAWNECIRLTIEI